MTPSPPAIRVGDLVVVARVCCDAIRPAIKPIFVVTAISGNEYRNAICPYCGDKTPHGELCAFWNSYQGWPLAHVRRIDPLQAPSQSEITTKEIA
jgi:hypothetical protein